MMSNELKSFFYRLLFLQPVTSAYLHVRECLSSSIAAVFFRVFFFLPSLLFAFLIFARLCLWLWSVSVISSSSSSSSNEIGVNLVVAISLSFDWMDGHTECYLKMWGEKTLLFISEKLWETTKDNNVNAKAFPYKMTILNVNICHSFDSCVILKILYEHCDKFHVNSLIGIRYTSTRSSCVIWFTANESMN